MSAGHLFLIILSSLGVIHGLFLSIFLWGYKSGHRVSNKILSLLLIILSFRVGKSIFLEFTPDLDVTFIFIGLGTLMTIGPLFYLYAQSCLNSSFKLQSKYFVHFIPALIGILFGFWVKESHLETLPKLFFFFLFISYYLHYLVYIIIAYSVISRKSKEETNSALISWLRLLFFGLLIIWFAYVLNLFDELIPYVMGPLLYSLVAYIVSFIAIRKNYLQKIDSEKYKTTPVSDDQVNVLFQKVEQLVISDKQYRNSELTLKSLSETMNVSTQILSLVINKKSKTNFNAFINAHRISEAIELFKDEKYHNRTIASIAFQVGFNSISSFNTAFKKQVGKTPLRYRRNLTE